MRYTYEEICYLLEKKHNKKISIRTLKRILKKLNLKRKNITETPDEQIISVLITEINGSGMDLGYRAMWQRLRDMYGFSVKQSTVLRLLNLVDPDGIEERSRYRLKRRTYSVPGPNFLWHIDGFDKLKRYGFAIHGCVDGYSRKVMWLHVSTTNNKPQVIAYYYLQCLEEFNLIPSLIRSDRGTENTVIDILHMGLRYYHEDEDAGCKSFLKGKSTANERIEKFWKQLRQSTLNFYIKLFKSMQHDNILDIGDIVHIEVLRYCFGPILKKDLENSLKEWNEHRIRKQNVINVISGIPNVLYYWPERYGARHCHKNVDAEDIQRLRLTYTEKPILYDDATELLIKMIFPDAEVPKTPEEAYNLFIAVIDSIKTIVGRR